MSDETDFFGSMLAVSAGRPIMDSAERLQLREDQADLTFAAAALANVTCRFTTVSEYYSEPTIQRWLRTITALDAEVDSPLYTDLLDLMGDTQGDVTGFYSGLHDLISQEFSGPFHRVVDYDAHDPDAKAFTAQLRRLVMVAERANKTKGAA